jgi:hypothetical protein
MVGRCPPMSMRCWDQRFPEDMGLANSLVMTDVGAIDLQSQCQSGQRRTEVVCQRLY